MRRSGDWRGKPSLSATKEGSALRFLVQTWPAFSGSKPTRARSRHIVHMRRPVRVKLFFLAVPFVQPTADQGEAKTSLQSFLHITVFCSAIETADRRPAGGAQCGHPEFLNHRRALLPSALFLELLLRCQRVSSIWKRRCSLGAELNVSVSSDVVPGACRSHPNSATCFKPCQVAGVGPLNE